MKQAAQQHSLNELTTELTAFRSWTEFAEAMNRGYTPSLLALPGKRNATRNAMVAELADRLEALGWKVWRG